MNNDSTYNNKILDAIRKKYRESCKKHSVALRTAEEQTRRMHEERDNLTYKEFTDLSFSTKELLSEVSRLSIEIMIWDQARDICLDILSEELENEEQRTDG